MALPGIHAPPRSRLSGSATEVDPVYGPDKKSVIVCLPFLGDHSIIIQRQLQRVVNKVTPWINLSVVLTPAFKLTTLSKLKCQVPVLSLSNVVYRINCNVCDQFYIGKTYRRLGQRIKEHKTSEESALTKHSLSTGHNMDYCNPQVLTTESAHTRLLIKETLKIKQYSANKSLNGNTGSFDLVLF